MYCSILKLVTHFFPVCWINSNVFGPNDNQSDSCSISIINAPGFPDHLTNESSTLSVLVTKYANEVLHNLYCTRLFVWEQVSVGS